MPLHRSDSSGDTFLFTSYLSTQDPAWDSVDRVRHDGAWPKVAGALPEHGSLAILHDCAATPGCVAYNGISYLAQAQAAGSARRARQLAPATSRCRPRSAIDDSVGSFVSLTPPNETISMIDGPSADGLPDRQLRVRRRQHQPAERGHGQRDQGLPDAG